MEQVTRPMVAVGLAYMYDGTRLGQRLAPARRLLEETLPPDALHQVRESARITYYRHVIPSALEPKADVIEDALPLFIMYLHNAAEAAAPHYGRLAELPRLVYEPLEELLREKREPPNSPMKAAVETLKRNDEKASQREPYPAADLGPLYSLAYTVAVVAYAYASSMQVMRLTLAQYYRLARASLRALEALEAAPQRG